MNKVTGYLKTFIREDFKIWFYVYTLIFLVVSIYLNYAYDLEYKWVMQYFGTYKAYYLGFTYNAFAYYMIAVPKAIVYKEKYIYDPLFWIKSSFFLLLLSIDGGLFHQHTFANSQTTLSYNEKKYLLYILNNTLPTFINIFPLLAFKYFYDRNEKGLYGLKLEGFDYKLYLSLILIMCPLIFWASFQPDFIEAYPQFKPWETEALFGLSKSQMSGLFEFVYAVDFVNTELLFRGALVIGLASIMGNSVILPMVTTYAYLHFGKPMAETIGSVFGGYILGVIALYSRNILGGCAIHIGVALLMELFALLQYYAIQN